MHECQLILLASFFGRVLRLKLVIYCLTHGDVRLIIKEES